MRLYKVLEKDLTSPYQKFPFELGQQYVCNEFDNDETVDCSYGYYAVDLEGLLYCFNAQRSIFEVEVSGRKVEYNKFKRRYEKIKIIRECSLPEVKEKCLLLDDNLGYKLSEALFPVNPLRRRLKPSRDDADNLKEWASVRASVGASVRASVRASVGASVRASVGAPVGASVGDSVRDSVRDSVWASVRASVGAPVWDSVRASVGDSVRDSVWDSVWDSVGDSVWDSVRASVRDSVRDSVWGYISSLFPNIEKWKYTAHENGKNPFQPCIDLWRRGFVPSYDGKIWRLHSGKKAEIVYEEEIK